MLSQTFNHLNQMPANRHCRMAPGFQHQIALKTVRLFDLAIVCGVFLTAFAISSSSLTWPTLAQVLVIRIQVSNLVLFAGYLGLCSAVFGACGLYGSHRLSRWPQRFYEIFLP